MTSESATILTAIQTLQALFLSLDSSLPLTTWRYPTSASLSDGASRDFIVVGGGTAGCTVANQLSASGEHNVLLIEAGPIAPLESRFTGLFPLMPLSDYDWDYRTTNNNYTGQYLQNNSVSFTAGKMLGGSSVLNHGIYVRGMAPDFTPWEEATDDSSWGYDGLLPYFKELENVYNNQNLYECSNNNSKNASLILTTEKKSANQPIIQSFVDIGYNYVENVTAEQTCGVGEPLLTIFDSQRISSADAFITPARNRSNLEIMLNARVTKINFDNNNTATGVQVIDSTGTEITLNANIEIIVTAGVIGTAHLLMLSGVGVKENLEQYNITTISDLPVGVTLNDHPSTSVVFSMDVANASTTPVNYGEFPVPVLCTYTSFENCSYQAEFQTIPLFFTAQSTALVQLCSQVFKYTNDICDKMYAASEYRNILYIVANILHPNSTGSITLQSANYSVQPLIYHGIYSNSTDLETMAQYLQGLYEIVNSTYFTDVGAELVDLELTECENYSKTSQEYWECYALCLSGTMWHFTGSCPMGTVTDNELRVKGVNRLRLGDASVITGLISGNIVSSVYVIALKLAAMILADIADSS